MQKTILFLVSFLLAGCAQKAIRPAPQAVGVFPGSFDPLTKAHLAIARAALESYQVKHLYVSVNTRGKDKDFFASFEERKEMWRQVLGKTERVTVQREPASGGRGFFDELLKKHPEGVYAFIGEDAYKGTPDPRENAHYVIIPRPGQDRGIPEAPRVEVLELPDAEGISSSQVRDLLGGTVANEEALAQALPPEVLRYVRERNLYRAPEKENHGKERFARAFARFKKKIRGKLGVKKAHLMTLPKFQPRQSEGEWCDKFIRHMIATLPETERLDPLSCCCP